MGFVTVYEQPYLQRFKANPVSVAFFIQIALLVIAIGAPIVLVALNPDSWPLYTTYYEQPRVRYQQAALVDLALGNGGSLTWSTMPMLNSLQQQTYRAAILKAKEEDDDGDRLPERLLVSLDIPLQPEEQIFGLTFIVFLSVALRDRTDFTMVAAAVVQHSAISSGTVYITNGALRLNQLVPLTQGNVDQALTIPSLNASSRDVEDYSIPKLLRDVGKANVSAVVDQSHPIWISGSTGSFRVEMTLTFPVIPVWFSTTVLHRLSTAGSFFVFWLFPFWITACLLSRFLFSYGFIPTIRNPEKYSMKTYAARDKAHHL